MRRRQLTVTLAVGVVLAFTLGLNLVVFSFVNALWLRPLPVWNSSRIAFVTGGKWGTLNTPSFSRLDLVTGQVAAYGQNANMHPWFEMDGVAATIPTAAVTPSYFRLFGLDVRGRDFQYADDRDGAETVAIISDALWARAFQRRDDVVGSVVETRPFPLRIIGIAPKDFHGARRGEHIDLWIPSTSTRKFASSESLNLEVMGRLKWGQSLRSVNNAYHAEYPRDRMIEFVPLDRVFGGSDAPTVLIREGQSLSVVGILALLVLAGGCTAVAATVMIDYERRQLEFSIRQALGASREQLVAALARELAVMAVIGAAGGLVFAWLCLRSLPTLRLSSGTDLSGLNLSIDWRVMLASVVAAAVALAAAAAFPVARFTHDRAMAILRSSNSTPSMTSQRIRQGLLAALTAATIIVLASAGLFVQAIVRGFSDAPGFDLDHVIFASVRLGPRPQTMSPVEAVAEGARSVERSFSALRGVAVVAQASRPIGTIAEAVGGRSTRVTIGDREEHFSLGWMPGGVRQRQALGVPLLAGRDLTEADRVSLSVPALITSTLAARIFPGQSPLGQDLAVNAPRGRIVIVGVLGDFAFGSLQSPADGSFILPSADDTSRGDFPQFILGTSDSAAAIVSRLRHDIGEKRPDVTIAEFVTGREAVSRDLARQQLGAWFFSGFGSVAFVLGIGCVFGLVSYLAKSRRAEFAVRMALGASGWRIMRLAIGSGLVPVAVGTVAGLAAAIAVARGFSSVLIGISTGDPTLYMVIAGAMIVACTLAAALASLPIRKISPSQLLKHS